MSSVFMLDTLFDGEGLRLDDCAGGSRTSKIFYLDFSTLILVLLDSIWMYKIYWIRLGCIIFSVFAA